MKKKVKLVHRTDTQLVSSVTNYNLTNVWNEVRNPRQRLIIADWNTSLDTAYSKETFHIRMLKLLWDNKKKQQLHEGDCWDKRERNAPAKIQEILLIKILMTNTADLLEEFKWKLWFSRVIPLLANPKHGTDGKFFFYSFLFASASGQWCRWGVISLQAHVSILQHFKEYSGYLKQTFFSASESVIST